MRKRCTGITENVQSMLIESNENFHFNQVKYLTAMAKFEIASIVFKKSNLDINNSQKVKNPLRLNGVYPKCGGEVMIFSLSRIRENVCLSRLAEARSGVSVI